MNITLSNLKDFIATHFSLEDMRSLCIEVGVNYDSLSEGGIISKSWDLIFILGRRYEFEKLLTEIIKMRPKPFDEKFPGLGDDTVSLEAQSLYEEIVSLAQLSKEPEIKRDMQLEDLIKEGKKYREWGQFSKAISYFNDVIKFTPSHHEALAQRAYTYRQMATFEDNPVFYEYALRDAKQAVEIKKYNMWAQIQLGMLLCYFDTYDDAYVRFTKSIGAVSVSILDVIYFFMALTSYALGNSKDAAEYIKRGMDHINFDHMHAERQYIDLKRMKFLLFQDLIEAEETFDNAIKYIRNISALIDSSFYVLLLSKVFPENNVAKNIQAQMVNKARNLK